MQNDLPNIPPAYPSPAKPPPHTRASTSASKGAIVARSALFALVILILLSVLDVFPHRYDRRQVDKIKCANNLRRLGLAAIAYGNAHNGNLPDDLQTLYAFSADTLDPKMLECPHVKPRLNSQATTQDVMQAIAAGQLSYIYCGKGLTVNSGDDVVLMYEPISDHGDGISVLFADTHVEWFDLEDAKKLIANGSGTKTPLRWPATQP